jgi:hypothetical protein
MKHWKLPLGAALDRQAAGALVREAAELNRKLGSPATR